MNTTIKHQAFVLALALLAPPVGAAAPPASSAVTSATDARNLLTRYCVTCHSDRLQTGRLTLESIDLTDVASSVERLEKVVQKLRVGAMPPLGAPRPEAAVYAALTSWIERELDRAAAARPAPGRPPRHVPSVNGKTSITNLKVDSLKSGG